MKVIEITTGESKSSSNGSTVMKTIISKTIPSNLLRVSLSYGFTIRCIKAIIPQATMST